MDVSIDFQYTYLLFLCCMKGQDLSIYIIAIGWGRQ